MINIDSAKLKWIAMITMFVDHIGAALIEKSSLFLSYEWQMLDMVFRMIGRIAFPLYCFLLVEAFLHTRSRERYLLSLFLMAIITEPVFDYAIFENWRMDYQNVLFTLLIGFLLLYIINKIEEKVTDKETHFIAGAFAIFLLSAVAVLFKTDYSYTGVVLIALFYLLRSDANKTFKCIVGSCMFLENPTAIIAFLLIYHYNGAKGELGVPHWFYRYFYPIHLLILICIRSILI